MRNALIVLPKAVVHWPVAAQDLLMTRELCHVKQGTHSWNLVGEIVTALYWPIPWVRSLAVGLDRSLEQVCGRLAMYCFNDQLGYERASKQLQQRLDGPGAPEPVAWEQDDEDVHPRGRHKYRVRSQRNDPQYDRVFWSLVQATTLVFILTGTTLRQLEVIDAEEVDLAERWYFSYERSADYADQQIQSTRRRR